MAATTNKSNGKPHGKPAERKQSDPSILERQLPFDREAERGVLGSIMLLPDCTDEVAAILREGDFHDEAHAKLFACLIAMREAGKRFDSTLLREWLEKRGDLEAVGGLRYIGEIINAVPHAGHAVYYAEIVRDKATLRNLIYASTDTLREAYSPTADAAALPGRAEAAIAEVSERRIAKTEIREWRDLVNDALAAMEKRLGGHSDGLDTGIHKLDDLTGGMKPGELWVIGGRTSMGKSALALNIASHVATARTVLFTSLEMAGIEFADRLLSNLSRVSGRRMIAGTLTDDERQRIVEAASRQSQLNIVLDDAPSRRVNEIAAAARRTKKKRGLDLIVVDYLQLVEPNNPRDDRVQQLGQVTRSLKTLAREMKVPVVALAQVSREAEKTKDGRPRLSHLRECGSIEQDADVVVFCHRPAYYSRTHADPEAGEEAELLLEKQRNGPTQTIPVLWFGRYTQFANPANDRQRAGVPGEGDVF